MDLPTQIAAAKRELAMRRGVYPKWVQSKKMSQSKADHEIEAMEWIVSTLEANLPFEKQVIAAVTQRALADRLVVIAAKYQEYVVALAETPAPDAVEHAARVKRFEAISNDLTRAAEILGLRR